MFLFLRESSKSYDGETFKMKKTNILLLSYFSATFVGCLAWLFYLNLYHFLGASSLVYSFVFAVASESNVMTWFCLIWFLLMIASLVTTFVIALKKRFFIPFLIVVGGDLCFSIFVLLFLLVYSNGYGFFESAIGLVLRSFYGVYLIRCVKKEKKDSFSS